MCVSFFLTYDYEAVYLLLVGESVCSISSSAFSLSLFLSFLSLFSLFPFAR